MNTPVGGMAAGGMRPGRGKCLGVVFFPDTLNKKFLATSVIKNAKSQVSPNPFWEI